MKKYIIAVLLAAAVPSAFAEDIKTLSLKDCEDAALNSSPAVSRLSAEAEAAEEAAKAYNTSRYPSLYLEGEGGYTTNVPEIKIGPLPVIGTVKQEVGDNWSWQAGPVARYQLFDYGVRNDEVRAARSMAGSKLAELDWEKKQVLLSVRLAYFKLMASLENMYLLSEQLETSRAQYRDISSAYKAGAKTERDLAMASKQVLSIEAMLSSSRSEAAGHMRDLFEITGGTFGIDPSYPMDYRLENVKGIPEASALIKTDDITAALSEFSGYSSLEFDSSSPALISANRMVDYYNFLSSSHKSSKWPTIGLSAAAVWAYPNFAEKETVFKGVFGANISMPIFEGGRKGSQAKQQAAQAKAAEAKKEEILKNMQKTFYSAKDRLNSLNVESKINDGIVKDNTTASELTYKAYKAGRLTYLEVDSANLSLVQSKISKSALNIERLSQLSVIAALGK
ncbi:outer membrane protein [Parelusimicrobium proximum]|uniref:TolC family protein n=1 Tax=Parelusimicrobium proximum TaxID=3228953 RepID=UPI003D181770